MYAGCFAWACYHQCSPLTFALHRNIGTFVIQKILQIWGKCWTCYSTPCLPQRVGPALTSIIYIVLYQSYLLWHIFRQIFNTCGLSTGCFFFEFHSVQFESLYLPIQPLPYDLSQFDLHGTLEDDKVKQLEHTWLTCLIEYI